jgi:hypothetical protein
MNSADKILEIISTRLKNLEEELKGTMDEEYKKHLDIERSVFRKLENFLRWQKLSSMEKQASRLAALASMRKSGAIEKLIQNQETAIKIYESINLTLPYIKVLNVNNKLDDLEQLCLKELEVIDSSGADFKGKHVNANDVGEAFKIYFERVQVNKSAMFLECYSRIDELYKLFNALSYG